MKNHTSQGWSSRSVWCAGFLFFAVQAAAVLRFAAPPPPTLHRAAPRTSFATPWNSPDPLPPWIDRQGPEAIYEMQMRGVPSTALAETYRPAEVVAPPNLLGVGNVPARIGPPPLEQPPEGPPSDPPVSLLVPERVRPGEIGQGSYVRASFPGGERQLAQPLRVADPEGTELREPTVIEVAVLPDGSVFAATIRKSSNSREMDERALRAAKAARLTAAPGTESRSPQDRYELEWGQLTFVWSSFREPPPASAR